MAVLEALKTELDRMICPFVRVRHVHTAVICYTIVTESYLTCFNLILLLDVVDFSGGIVSVLDKKCCIITVIAHNFVVTYFIYQLALLKSLYNVTAC